MPDLFHPKSRHLYHTLNEMERIRNTQDKLTLKHNKSSDDKERSKILANIEALQKRHDELMAKKELLNNEILESQSK